jgi:7-cyano-7-deazaguanine synthase
MNEKTKNAVVLLSGGLDSSTVGAIARQMGFSLYALTFSYGQRHAIEIARAKQVANRLQATRHVVYEMDSSVFGGSALTDQIPVPKNRSEAELSEREIPVTYVPARNIIFLSIAAAFAESIDARDLFIGVNAVDYSGYPDCRPAFIDAFTRALHLGTKSGVEGRGISIHTPLISMTKGEIIERGIASGVDYSITNSCYDPDKEGRPCLRCDSCLLRAKGFAEAGLDDPLLVSFADIAPE